MERDWQQRAREGEQLAGWLGQPGVNERLLQLLLDPLDTEVTSETAGALLARHDDPGVQLIVGAAAQTDDNHSDWLFGAFADFRANSLGEEDGFPPSKPGTGCP